MKKKIGTTVLGLALSLALVLPAAAAAPNSEATVVINGVKVHGDGTHMESGEVWVDAQGYLELLSTEYTYDENKNEINVKSKSLPVELYQGKPSVHVRAIAAATGGDNILWDQLAKEVYILDLPEGSISLEGTTDVMAMGVPGMGQHWGSPTELPLGPIYGVEKGKLVFIEQMVSQEDFQKGSNHVNIPGMKGLPSPSIVHTDIEFLPKGHPGFEVAHFDIHHYFVTHEEHLKFSMPPGGAMPGHQH